MTEKATNSGEIKDAAQNKKAQTEAFSLRKQIGSTTYEVTVHFNPASRETLEDKILRLARNGFLTEEKESS